MTGGLFYAPSRGAGGWWFVDVSLSLECNVMSKDAKSQGEVISPKQPKNLNLIIILKKSSHQGTKISI